MSNGNTHIIIITILVVSSVTIVFFLILIWYILYDTFINCLRKRIKIIDKYYINKDINRLIKLSKLDKLKLKNNNEICSICMDNGNNKYLKLKCNHIFHLKCIKQWIEQNNSCPLCRNTIINITNIHEL